MLKDNASAKIPRVNYAYPIYASSSPHSRQLHTSTLVRASSAHVLVSYNPSFQARILKLPFGGVSKMLVARRRCSRMNNLSSLQPFYHFNRMPVCTRPRATRHLHAHVPCYFISRDCPKIPGVPLRRVRRGHAFLVGRVPMAPLHMVRNELPVLKCHVKGVKCVASVLAVPSMSCRRLHRLSILIMGTLQVTPRPARRGLTRTLSATQEVKTGRACFVRVDRRVKLRTRIRARLPPRICFTSSKLRVFSRGF